MILRTLHKKKLFFRKTSLFIKAVMSLRSEPAILNYGAILVEAFAIAIELFVGSIAILALCSQRYDRSETLNISFAKDLRRLSITAPGPPQMTSAQFHRKLIRYARYALLLQWCSYLICHVLILSHEFLTEPDIIDHLIYITFLVQITMLFLTFRNIGIYYFWSVPRCITPQLVDH